jgi:predicted NBD/HSP70 family sugar kinase
MQPANRELIRAINRFNILNTIRMTGSISRVEIADLTCQSRASVTNITAKLIKDNLIYEKEIKDSALRGRRRVLLALNPNAVYVVGVKVSSFRISCAVTDMQADVRSSIILPVRISKRSAEFVADLIEEGVRHCISDARLTPDKISGIGLGIPGFVDSDRGFCHWTPLYQKGVVRLSDLIQARLRIPTFLENDANAVTMAHQWFGEGKGIDNFLVITLEDGVGTGIVVNGQIYRGHRGIGAEFGHMVVDPAGAPCRCGKTGCVEAYASDFSILEAAKQAREQGLWNCPDDAELTIESVTDAALTKEPALIDIFQKAGEMLGLGISALIQLFSPQRIILSGEGVRAGDLIFAPMRAAIEQHTNPEIFSVTEIVVQKWRDTDWARGAASLVLQEIYKSPFQMVRPGF